MGCIGSAKPNNFREGSMNPSCFVEIQKNIYILTLKDTQTRQYTFFQKFLNSSIEKAKGASALQEESIT